VLSFAKMAKSFPDFNFEETLWKEGVKVIGGVDEVGRGAFAGPVVAACVIYNKKQKIDVLIHDSKKLTQKQREKASIWIKNHTIWGIGSASAYEIDKLGIVKATNKAFREAIRNCNTDVNHLIIDAFFVPRVRGISQKNQTPIIKGDTQSISIASASIIAKVYRDEVMTKLAKNKNYKPYGWERNKGYGTKEHRNTIKTIGKSRLHRVSFLLKLS
jgi:ribonuclease HII